MPPKPSILGKKIPSYVQAKQKKLRWSHALLSIFFQQARPSRISMHDSQRWKTSKCFFSQVDIHAQGSGGLGGVPNIFPGGGVVSVFPAPGGGGSQNISLGGMGGGGQSPNFFGRLQHKNFAAFGGKIWLGGGL